MSRLFVTSRRVYPQCHAGRDGECSWKKCPQLLSFIRRGCPLDNLCPTCRGGEDAPACRTCRGQGFVVLPPGPWTGPDGLGYERRSR